jgi:hypothetical protein
MGKNGAAVFRESPEGWRNLVGMFEHVSKVAGKIIR